MSNIIKAEHWDMIEKKDWPWADFTPMEMACRGTGAVVVSHLFMTQLQGLRAELGKPMHLTSACRTLSHNNSVGGHPTSFHICDSEDGLGRGQEGCLAVDVAATEGKYRGELFSLAWKYGWSVGWNAKRGFLHLDRRVDVGWKQTTFDY